MKQSFLAAVFASAVCIASVDQAFAHGGNYGGGTYGGPGDTVPPGGGSTGGGAGGPATPGGGGPSTPGPGGPTTPGMPGTGGPSTPGGGGGPMGPMAPSTGGAESGQDLTRWQVWWELNKEPYLDLRRRIYLNETRTGSDDFFLGRTGESAHDYLRPSLQRVREVIVPALFAAFERETSNDVITGALLALAKIGNAPESQARWSFADRFASFLTHSNQEVAETAALALGILGDVEQMGLLAALLRDERSKLASFGVRFKSAVPERTRVFAAYALGLLGRRADEYDSCELARILSEPLADGGRAFAKRDLPVACVLAFGLITLPPASGAQVPEVEPGEFLVREHQIAWLLERYGDRGARALIRAQMPRSLVRLAADLETTNPARARVVETLLASLESKTEEDVYVRQSCVLALGELADCDADALDARVRAMFVRVHGQSADQQLKRYALIALAQVCGRAGTGDALAGLRSKKEDPRAFLAERLRKGQGNERCWAALALAVLERSLEDQKLSSSPQTRTVLRWALGEATSGQEVGAYAIALGLLSDRAAVPALLVKLEKIGDPEARGYVALALGMLGDARATESVQAVVAKSKYQAELLRSAAQSLALIGDRDAVPRLIEMLGTANSLSSQAAIASALGTIGDSRSVDPLVAMLANSDLTAASRGFAAAALGIVADERALSWVASYALGINYRACTETLNSVDGGTGLLQLL